jgi:hypothetical protein
VVFRNPLNNSTVIPGKLAAIPPEADQPQAEVSATRNTGKKIWIPPFDRAAMWMSSHQHTKPLFFL